MDLHVYFIWISNAFQLDFQWVSVVTEFILGNFNEILTGFPMGFHGEFNEMSAGFQMDFLSIEF